MLVPLSFLHCFFTYSVTFCLGIAPSSVAFYWGGNVPLSSNGNVVITKLLCRRVIWPSLLCPLVATIIFDHNLHKPFWKHIAKPLLFAENPYCKQKEICNEWTMQTWWPECGICVPFSYIAEAASVTPKIISYGVSSPSCAHSLSVGDLFPKAPSHKPHVALFGLADCSPCFPALCIVGGLLLLLRWDFRHYTRLKVRCILLELKTGVASFFSWLFFCRFSVRTIPISTYFRFGSRTKYRMRF